MNASDNDTYLLSNFLSAGSLAAPFFLSLTSGLSSTLFMDVRGFTTITTLTYRIIVISIILFTLGVSTIIVLLHQNQCELIMVLTNSECMLFMWMTVYMTRIMEIKHMLPTAFAIAVLTMVGFFPLSFDIHSIYNWIRNGSIIKNSTERYLYLVFLSLRSMSTAILTMRYFYYQIWLKRKQKTISDNQKVLHVLNPSVSDATKNFLKALQYVLRQRDIELIPIEVGDFNNIKSSNRRVLLICDSGIGRLADNVTNLTKAINATELEETEAQRAAELQGRIEAERAAGREAKIEAEKEKLLEKPWRGFEKRGSWTEEYVDILKNDINGIKHLNVSRSRILLFGPMCSGKSSFINSVATIDYGYIAAVVEAGSSSKSVTLMMNQYLPKHFATNFALIDTMGIAESDALGIHVEDTKALMEGKFKVACKFNPASPVTTETEIKPSLEEVGHCTVIMVDARVIDTGSISDNLAKKIESVNEYAKQSNQRKVVVLTKIDLVCGKVGENIENVYTSRKMYEIVKKAEEKFGVPEMNIFPVQNYSKEVDLDWKMNILILLALRQMVRYSHNRLENLHDQFNIKEEQK